MKEWWKSVKGLQITVTIILLVATGIIAPTIFQENNSGNVVVASTDDDSNIQSRYPLVGMHYESPFVSVGEKLQPAVVFINVEKEQVIQGMPFGRGVDPFRDFFNLPRQNSEPQKRIIPGSGSGVIIDKEGYVLTNNHVVDDAKKVMVKLEDGEEREAEIIGTDPESDLALLSIGKVKKNQVGIMGDSDEIRIGDWAIAMGNPLGLEWTLTVGVISAKGRSNLNISGRGPAYQDFIQTDASINFGNSGGPLANIKGEIIGINTAINASGQNIGFAIPINMAKEVVRQLKEKGSVSRGYLGMLPTELSNDLKEALRIDEDKQGVFVETVEPNTPAEEGGLEASDVVIEVDGESVSDVNDFRFRVAKHSPGSKMELTVLRNGKKKKLDFVLGDRSEYLATAAKPSEHIEEWMGLNVAALTSQEARRFRFEVEDGVVIIGMEQESPANGKLSVGDVITKIGDFQIKTMDDWKKATQELKDSDKAVLIMYHPSGQLRSRFVALKK